MKTKSDHFFTKSIKCNKERGGKNMTYRYNVCTMLKVLTIITGIFFIFVVILITVFSQIPEQRNILTAIAQEGDNTQVGNAIINFSQNQIVEGNALSHEEGSNIIRIMESGIYQISYQLLGEEQTIGTFNFNAALLVNNSVLEDTLNESPILRENIANRMTLTSTVILRLEAGDILQLGGLSIEDIIYNMARIDIEKIG